MRTIALEEHYATAAFLRGPGSWLASRVGIIEPISDLGDDRIAAMDDGGVDLAVLSLAAPGVEQLDGAEAVGLARQCNDELAAAVARYPDRLAGFATVPVSAPDAAADELERAVRTLGFPARLSTGTAKVVTGRSLLRAGSGPRRGAQRPDLPAPDDPAERRYRVQLCGILRRGRLALATVGFGVARQHRHSRAAVDSWRRVRPSPEIEIIIGHMGEATSFMLPRFDATLKPELTGLAHPVSTYLRQNLHYTFANFNDEATYANLVAQVGVGRIVVSADYPFGSMRAARDFLDKLPLSDDERAAISHRNAEQLLGV